MHRMHVTPFIVINARPYINPHSAIVLSAIQFSLPLFLKELKEVN